MSVQETVALVHVVFPTGSKYLAASLVEFELLAAAAGAKVLKVVTATRKTPDSRTFIGRGKVSELREVVAALQLSIVLFNHDLSPSQERAVSEAIACRVLSRTGVILDIFAKRARTYEGKLQVELAQLQYIASRLVGMWTHLERQKGGIGLRGPGETQLETDRRLIKGRVAYIEERLLRVRGQRMQSREARLRAEVPTIALVGYTNAGKSTLFNRLTGASVFAANQLFATLDPTLRALELPGIGRAVLADTVGFIQALPPHLVDAFRATLEETAEATVLLQVLDSTDRDLVAHQKEVEKVLKAVGAADVPTIFVYNKVDLLAPESRLHWEEASSEPHVFVSAETGEGLETLLEALKEVLGKEWVEKEVVLSPDQGALRAALFEINAVQKERCDEQGYWHIALSCSKRQWERILHNNEDGRHGVE